MGCLFQKNCPLFSTFEHTHTVSMDYVYYCLEVNSDLYVNVDCSFVYKQKKGNFFTQNVPKKIAL